MVVSLERGGIVTAFGALLLALGGLLLPGCEPADPAQSAAGLFVDRYYVELDLAAARPYATGLALAKLTREAELLAGIDAPVNAGKPTVHYRLLEESGTSGPDQRSFLFELTISFTDAQVTRMALVTLQQNGAGAWQVANFEELQ
jgi:hypothetical protein